MKNIVEVFAVNESYLETVPQHNVLCYIICKLTTYICNKYDCFIIFYRVLVLHTYTV